MFAFAESLFAERDYYRAITEYKRLLFLSPQGQFAKEAKFKIAKSYQLGEQYDLAYDLFSSFSEAYAGERLGILSRFEIAEAISEQGSATNNIAAQVERIAQMSEESSAAAGNSAQAANELDRLAREMQGIVGAYRL